MTLGSAATGSKRIGREAAQQQSRHEQDRGDRPADEGRREVHGIAFSTALCRSASLRGLAVQHSHRAVLPQPVLAVDDDGLVGLEARIDQGLSLADLRHRDGAHLRLALRRNHVDVGSALALLHGRRGDGQPVLSRVDEQPGIDQLARPQQMCGVGKGRLELNGARRLGNLVVDQEKLAFIQLDLVVLAVGEHGQRPFGHLRLDLRQIPIAAA